jgi:hypothetical protein
MVYDFGLSNKVKVRNSAGLTLLYCSFTVKKKRAFGIGCSVSVITGYGKILLNAAVNAAENEEIVCVPTAVFKARSML